MSDAAPEYRGFAKVFWSGRSHAVRLPAACRFETSEIEIVKTGEIVTLRPRGKNWTSYFEATSRGSLPARRQPPLDDRESAFPPSRTPNCATGSPTRRTTRPSSDASRI